MRYDDDEAEPEPEPETPLETELRESLLQGTEPPPESMPVKPEQNTDLDRYRAMHSKQPSAVEEYVPPSFDGAGGGYGMSPSRSALDAVAKMPAPAYTPIPQAPPPEPGFRGALKDALRGMIPGYMQGQQAALREQQLEAVQRNKYEMDLYKQQMGLMKPMLTQDYETQAALQKVQMTAAYLRQTYPWMTEAEIATRSLGKPWSQPNMPGQGIPREFHFPPGIVPNDRLVAVMNKDGKWIAPGGQEIPPEILNKTIGVGKETPPPATQLVPDITDPKTGKPTYGEYTPGRAGQTKGTIAPIPGAPIKFHDPELAKARLANTIAGLDLSRQRLALGEVGKFNNNQIVKKYAETMPMIERAMTADPKNPADHEAILYAFARINDERTGVREPERETVRANTQSVLAKTKLDILKLWDSPGSLTPQAIAFIRASLSNWARIKQQQYDDFRDETTKSFEAITGTAQDFPDHSQNYRYLAEPAAAPGKKRGSRTGVVSPPANPKDGETFVDLDSVTWIFQDGEWVEQ